MLGHEVVFAVANDAGAELLAYSFGEGLFVVVDLADKIICAAAPGDTHAGVVLLEVVITDDDIATPLEARTAHGQQSGTVAAAGPRDHVFDGKRVFVGHRLRNRAAPAVLPHGSTFVHMLCVGPLYIHLNR